MAVQVKDALVAVDSSLRTYAARRKPELLVGQFMDPAGQAAQQKGIYGMCAFLRMVADGSATEDSLGLRSACSTYLKKCVGEAMDQDLNDLDAGSDAYEVRRIAPKAAAVLHALAREGDATGEAARLLKHIMASRRNDGLWAFLLDNNEGDVIASAIILRALRAYSDSDSRHDSEAALWSRARGVPNPVQRLYVLNTVVMLRQGRERVDVRRQVKETIGELYETSGIPPYEYPNPINIDYHDGDRVRYFRLPTDAVLLESLALLTDGDASYLSAHGGAALLNSIVGCLSEVPLAKDPSGHRAALSSVLYYWEVLVDIEGRSRTPASPAWRAWGWIKSAWAFGPGMQWNVAVFGVSVVVAIIFHFVARDSSDMAWWAALRNGAIGVAFKSLVDFGLSLPGLRHSRTLRRPG